MRLAGKASVPAGGPFIVLLPAGGPAVGPVVHFGLVCKCFISCCRSFFPQQQLLLTAARNVSGLNPDLFRVILWALTFKNCTHTARIYYNVVAGASNANASPPAPPPPPPLLLLLVSTS